MESKKFTKVVKKRNVVDKISKAIKRDKAPLMKSIQVKNESKIIIKKVKTPAKKNSHNTLKESMVTPEIHSSTVFVGNLPVNVNRIQIVQLFKDYAPVKSVRLRTAAGKLIFKHKQRREAGAINAYVVLDNAVTAEKSLALNNTEYKGKYLRVTKAELSKYDHDAKSTVLVGNLRYSADEDKLRDIFSCCGEIEYIRCLRSDKGCKGVAYVCFKSSDAVNLALELKNTMLDERPINVERYSANKLGAKKARDEREVLERSGAQQRIKNKTNVNPGNTAKSAKDNGTKKRKVEFHGVKVDKTKQKGKLIKTNEMQKLAKKIAPRMNKMQ